MGPWLLGRVSPEGPAGGGAVTPDTRALKPCRMLGLEGSIISRSHTLRDSTLDLDCRLHWVCRVNRVVGKIDDSVPIVFIYCVHLLCYNSM